MLSDKANAICVLEILKEYSDAEHIMPMREIISKLKIVYDLDIDRRTVYSAIDLLKNDLCYEIETYEENKQGYYLTCREFEQSEVRMLMDAVCFFENISSHQRRDLLKKLQNFLSIYQRKQYTNLIIMNSESPAANKAIFWIIDLLDEAISKQVKVEFTYLTYNLDKKLVPRRNIRYLVNPYALVFANDHYYLVCSYEGYDNISHYRIDKICDVKILQDEPV